MKYKSQKDGETKQFVDYSKKKIFTGSDFFRTGFLLQKVTVPPNTKMRKHVHHTQTEVYYILSGECEIIINDFSIKAVSGDGFIISPEDTHYLWNKTNQNFDLAVFKYDVPEIEDNEWLE
jgi:mannose-6-phosphate isomerase-like protein (cupin superfamily)